MAFFESQIKTFINDDGSVTLSVFDAAFGDTPLVRVLQGFRVDQNLPEISGAKELPDAVEPVIVEKQGDA